MRIETCRICESDDLRKFLDLGATPLADAFIPAEKLKHKEAVYPLHVCSCGTCGLVQLDYVVPPDILYDENYVYESSITKLGQQHWTEFVRSTTKICKLEPDDLVIDIGSNVGVLLQKFSDFGVSVIGVDPAVSIVEIAHQRGIETIGGFFTQDVAQHIRDTYKPAKIITATNVFAHVHDLTALTNAVEAVLAPDGVFVIEAPYLPNLISSLEYDTIYHEHLSYLSLRPLRVWFEKFNMEIFEVQLRDFHGGAFRVFVRRKSATNGTVAPIIDDLLDFEERHGIYELERLQQFARDVALHKEKIYGLLKQLKSDGRRIVGVSAPAKGMTLLNYCGINGDVLDFITEKSTLKIGRYSPGHHIPIVPDIKLLEEQPDYGLILAWNFADEIMYNLSDYLECGGKFIVPVPEPRIVG